MVSASTDKIIKNLGKIALSLEDRTALLNAILGKLSALPLSEAIVISQNSVIINGNALDMEQIISFRESAIALKDNRARKIIHEQVRYMAVNMGIYKSVSLDELHFSKAALWCMAEENKLLDKLV